MVFIEQMNETLRLFWVWENMNLRIGVLISASTPMLPEQSLGYNPPEKRIV